jgi:hypothetical protein
MSNNQSAPLSDSIIVAVSQLVDDAQADRRDPSHSDLEFEIKRAGLIEGDPRNQGQIVGKAKRVRSTLNWALEYNPEGGGLFVHSLITSSLRGHGGFREGSPNYVGKHAIESAVSAFASEGYDFSHDGELRPRVLEGLSGIALTDAIEGYIRRAKCGYTDAALLVGTSKDLLEAVAAHILQLRYGGYSSTSNFPTLLGQVFVALGLATPMDPVTPGEPPNKRVERAMYELACGVNQLRNKEGTDHGRPWLPSVTDAEARMAIESMGVIAERLLSLHRGIK